MLQLDTEVKEKEATNLPGFARKTATLKTHMSPKTTKQIVESRPVTSKYNVSPRGAAQAF